MRNRTYSFFIAFFFISMLILSGCKTVDYINDNKESNDTITSSNNDTIVEDSLSFNLNIIDNKPIIKLDTSTFNNDTLVADTLISNDSILSTHDSIPGHSVIITEQKKESFIEDKIERSCNDSTIQDFKKNKIYY